MPDATIDGAVIHYETAGEGFPLVLLHGIGSNSRSWRRQLSALSAGFQVIAWDAPGYGRSSDPPGPPVAPSMTFYADQLRRLIDSLQLEKIFLLGHSTGGVIAQEFYRAYPDRVTALVLADTRFVGSSSALEERRQSIRTKTPAQLAADRGPKLLSSGAQLELVAEVVSIMSEIRPAGYEFAAVALAGSDTQDVIRNLGVPTLLIWGAQDEITPVWEDIPAGTRVEVIPGAGHLCYIEKPDAFNKIVKDFWRNIQPRSGDTM